MLIIGVIPKKPMFVEIPSAFFFSFSLLNLNLLKVAWVHTNSSGEAQESEEKERKSLMQKLGKGLRNHLPPQECLVNQLRDTQ